VCPLCYSVFTDDIGIAALCLGPGFFEDEHPEFVAEGLTEEGLSMLVDGDEVVDHDFFKLSMHPQSYFVYSSGMVALSFEHGPNNGIAFGKCGQS
jgi:hypothetical protein